jgi:hypothetical protein
MVRRSWKGRALGFNNNDANSSTPKANPQGSYPSLAPLPVNNDNFAYGLTPNPASGQYPQFQPHRPNMATPDRCRIPVRPVLWSWCPINLCQFLSCQIRWSLLFLVQSVMLDLIIVRQWRIRWRLERGEWIGAGKNSSQRTRPIP